jgi:hypothetical protein
MRFGFPWTNVSAVYGQDCSCLLTWMHSDMFKMLVDTCVWLDFAKDQKQRPVLDAVEEMVSRGMLVLMVPRIVLYEFGRNRDRILKESVKSLSTHIRIVKEAVGKVGGDQKKTRIVLSHLNDVSHKGPMVGGTAGNTLDRIGKLLRASESVEASEEVMVRAAQRAIKKQAPFHRDKNAMADAILIEVYAECVRSNKAPRGARFAFVTHNKNDFSIENGNQRLPHPDFASFFSRIKSFYFINLPEALRRIEPSLVRDVMFEQSWEPDFRSLADILNAEHLLFNQVWYNRHWNLRIGVEEGRIKVVDKESYPRRPGVETVQKDIWKGALKSARKVEGRFGKQNLGPWDDFEWGMINGKLSALRWVLGDEWDMLDT